MIICSASNIDLIQGTVGYGDPTEGASITDWRISNTQSAIAGQSGVFNIFNSTSSNTPCISIVDSGTVGIGTVPGILSTSKMEIVGNVNITGAYNINNRNVIADTSNYILSTSNILVERINAGGGGSGSLTSGGNLTLSNNATSNTILSIQNNFTSNYTSNYTSNVVTGSSFIATFADANVPSTHAQVTDTPNDRYMIFTTASVNHTFTVPAGGLNCDILMIGGGGCGPGSAGGGAGACIVAINQTLPAGSCVVNVGAGGNNVGLGSNGSDSYITVGTDRYRAKGGGVGAGQNLSGGSGGCGGAAGYNSDTTSESGGAVVQTNVVNGSLANIGPSITSTYAVMGNAGGNNGTVSDRAGSGGGIGTAGTTGGKGGDGAYQVTLTTSPTTTINFRNYFANGGTFGVLNSTDSQYYIGGGGGGYNGSTNQAGGLGGGGGASISPVANTGSGSQSGVVGASGLIIIRYRSGTTTTTPTAVSTTITTFGVPTIELIRGTQGDNNLDYKLGNYDGNFKIMSSISNTDTDRLSISSSGAISLSNNATSNTVLSIANSNVVYGTIQGTSNYTSNVVTGTAFIATFADSNVPSTHAQVTDTPTDRYMIFTTASVNHTFTVPAGGLNCDILMIGGGAGGNSGGSGGAGACIVAINQTLPAGSCVVNVGFGTTNNSGTNGADSTIQVGGTDRYRAKGGGITTGGSNTIGNNGGCGGGAGYNTDSTTEGGGAAVQTNVVNGSLANIGPSITSTYAVMGNAGGNNGTSSGKSGSGGGIGTAGVSAGKGGDGAYQVTLTTSPTTTINFRNYFANGSTSFGVQDGATTNYYIGGGGGAFDGGTNASISGGLGGGGGAGISTVVNTGGGGGYLSSGGHGASGIIIIRYRTGITTTPTPASTPITIPTATLGVPTIELIRGTQGDNNLDYKLGNYDGNFKIMSSISSIDTDRLSINSSTNSTALSIINRDFVVATTPATGGLVSALTTTGSPTIGTIGTTDRYMIFTASGSFTVPTGGINCDILMIGGGGAGGNGGGGGGGAGACIVAVNQTLSTTGTYTVNVGTGDTASAAYTGAGGDSSIVLSSTTLYLAKGGGRGEQRNYGRNQGGCGGGAGWEGPKTGGTTLTTNIVNGIITGPTLSSTFVVLGNKGGDRLDSTNGITGAGGGGIGGPGGNHITSSINAGPGGTGVNQVAINGITYNFKSYFAGGTTFGNNNDGFIGGGGGGSVYLNTASAGPNTGGLGGVGGGGKGGISFRTNPDGTSLGAENAVAGTANTGGGGGGAWGYSTTGIGGNGGSGIVIVRYRVATAVVGVPSVELIRGVAGDSNHDYKVGNYDGNFKIMSSVSNTDAERINITSVGNVGIGTSSPANELHIFDSTTSATSLIIQNNNMMMTSNTTQGTSTATSSTTGYSDGSFADNKPSTHILVPNTTDRIMIFTTASVNHTFTIPAGGLSCDILMIGGGGGGGFTGGGGGAGACIVAINQTLPAGSCVVNVGAGGENDSNGFDSFIFRVGDNDFRYLAKGGGGTQNWAGSGRSGGCGGGAGQNYNNGAISEGPYVGGTAVSTNIVNGSTAIIGPGITSTYAVLGYKGGDQLNTTQLYTQQAYTCAGGGGIGQAGFNHPNNDVNGAGGGNGRYFIDINGYQYNFRHYFANGSTSFGVQDGTTGNYYIGGGGAGNGFYGSKPSGGLGGGGQGNYLNSGLGPVANTKAGTANTGSGGGGGYGNGGNGSGGSGIIIIRYKNGTIPLQSTITTYTHTSNLTTTLTTTLGTPSIELVRGTQGDSNTDYKIGNYSGDFIVKSSVSGVDSDYIRMLGTNGAIYNFTNSLYWTQTSDRRIKENIARASYDMCYDNIDKLELNRFNYIKEFNTGNKDTNQLGFIAQEIKEIFPKAVFTNNYSGADLNIQDMLSIDIGQINYTLYGAVKKLMEINKDKEARLKRLEGLLNIEDGSGSSGNVVVDSSNVVVDTSNLLDTSSNIAIDTSNLLEVSNISIDTSNLLDTSSNIAIDTSNLLDTSNITIDTSNLLDTSNIAIDTSNILDTSNIIIDTSNLLDTSSNIY